MLQVLPQQTLPSGTASSRTSSTLQRSYSKSYLAQSPRDPALSRAWHPPLAVLLKVVPTWHQSCGMWIRISMLMPIQIRIRTGTKMMAILTRILHHVSYMLENPNFFLLQATALPVHNVLSFSSVSKMSVLHQVVPRTHSPRYYCTKSYLTYSPAVLLQVVPGELPAVFSA